jgi:hypothetical protein
MTSGGTNLGVLMTSSIKVRALKALFGLFLFCATVYLLLDSNLLSILEGNNPDGSSSLTWRSAVAALVLFLICQLISLWTFRRRIAPTLFLGMACCILSWFWLSGSKFAFQWEPHHADGTFPLTWRSDLFLLMLIGASLGLSFFVRQARRLLMRRRIVAQPGN